MNYKKHYDLLMEKARQRDTVEGYKERHHIVPRCMGGSNKKENLVELTAREHYVAHRLLYYEYKTAKLARAWVAMCMSTKTQQRNLTARQYERIRCEWSAAQTGLQRPEKVRELLRSFAEARKGVPLSEETRKRMSDGHKGKKRSDYHKERISESLRGKPKSADHIQKMKAPKSEQYKQKVRGIPKSEEHKQKLRISAQQREERKRTQALLSMTPAQLAQKRNELLAELTKIDKELLEIEVLLNAVNSI